MKMSLSIRQAHLFNDYFFDFFALFPLFSSIMSIRHQNAESSMKRAHTRIALSIAKVISPPKKGTKNLTVP